MGRFDVCYTRHHGNAVKGFWALWEDLMYIIPVTMVMLLSDFGPYGIRFDV
jgi:hypothetical protein